ncbi:spore coat protein [bacterium 1xD42-67]|nr:spore coat protein [bacterium 1xD42-67]
MNDQERITDLLCSEKKMSANYDTFASECVNVALRDDFLNIFSRGHQTQTDLFKLAQSKGWYQVEQAPASKVSQAYTRFSNQQPTM